MVRAILLWKLQKIWAVIRVESNYLLVLAGSAVLDVFCSGSFSHLVKVYAQDFHLGGLSKW